MHHHRHLTLEEREDIMMMRREGKSLAAIGKEIGRDRSTVSREIARNGCQRSYRASTAQRRYLCRRKACCRHRKLGLPELFEAVRCKFIEEQWSPEQIEGRLALERPDLAVSDSTIYRAINAGAFDGCIGGRKARRRLRHRGKARRCPATAELRGKIKVSHEISERPAEADSRCRLGDWEADTLAGRSHGACLLTLVDRCSGLLAGGKASKQASVPVARATVKALRHQPRKTVTPDRGKEFARHADVTSELDVEYYFALPHHPWQRGSCENTNGLLREYYPKGTSFDKVTLKEVQSVYDKLNRRPRKRLGYKVPYEVHYSTVLQLF